MYILFAILLLAASTTDAPKTVPTTHKDPVKLLKAEPQHCDTSGHCCTTTQHCCDKGDKDPCCMPDDKCCGSKNGCQAVELLDFKVE